MAAHAYLPVCLAATSANSIFEESEGFEKADASKVVSFGPLCLSSDSTLCQLSESLANSKIRRAVARPARGYVWVSGRDQRGSYLDERGAAGRAFPYQPRKANGSTVPDCGILLHQSLEQCRMQLPMCSHPALFRNGCEADELARVEPLGHECEQLKRGRLIWYRLGCVFLVLERRLGARPVLQEAREPHEQPGAVEDRPTTP
eukprot:scaffold88527_cov75-Phaeocystis_antarctica.AAC.4